MNDDYRNRGGQLSMLLTGIVIGAAAAVLVNEDYRQKVRQKFMDWSEVGKDRMQQGKRKLAAGLDSARKKLEEDETE